MENRFIIDLLIRHFGQDILESDATGDMMTVTVTSPVLYDLISFLKEEEEMGFTFLTDLCGIHYPDQGLPLGVVYHMHNMRNNKRIRVKTFVTVANPVVRSVTGLFASANWMERETYDFYGIIFEGHPNLTRILNVDYMDYFPLRKEYPLEDLTREDKDDKFFGR
jgi:NADH-quinone oxidoreductase subunit C